MPIPTDFDYTRKWTNSDDFPTYEAEEAKVRADMQALFDQIRDALNALAVAIIGANIPCTPISGGVADTVDGALAELKAAVDAATTGTLPDGSIATVKLMDSAVTEAKLADDAVSEDKIVDGAVSGDKVAAGAVAPGKLALTDGCFETPAVSLTAGVHYFDTVAALEAAYPTAKVGQIAFVKV